MKTLSFGSNARLIRFDEADSAREEAFRRWFSGSKVVDDSGRPLRVYHGSQRVDRIGSKINPKRATSGPMPYFTDDPEVASNYSISKADTSLQRPDDYADWFMVKVPGRRNPVSIIDAWNYLDAATRSKLKEKVYTVGYEDPYEADGAIVGNSRSIMPKESIDWEIRNARGNVLKALVEIWLNSAAIFDDEEKFMDVLKAAGMNMSIVKFQHPDESASGIIPAYLAIRNPLRTSNIPSHVVAALERAGRRKRRSRDTGSNRWDKNIVSGKEWIDSLYDDIKNGTTYVWTQVPDWVTKTLQVLGYDGIQDTGGKHSGIGHQVWIPFHTSQVKSVFSKGFDPEKKSLVD